MPMSLKVMLKKFAHKGQITQEEYDALIKKLDGHDKEIRNKALDEFAEKMIERKTILFENGHEYINAKWVDKIAEQLKERE